MLVFVAFGGLGGECKQPPRRLKPRHYEQPFRRPEGLLHQLKLIGMVEVKGRPAHSSPSQAHLFRAGSAPPLRLSDANFRGVNGRSFPQEPIYKTGNA